MSVSADWIKCQGDQWCHLQTLNLNHAHFNGLEGVYVIWHSGRNPWTVYVGQGVIANRLAAHREDPDILKFRDLGLYVTWASVAARYRDGVERYLTEQLKPKVGARYPDTDRWWSIYPGKGTRRPEPLLRVWPDRHGHRRVVFRQTGHRGGGSVDSKTHMVTGAIVGGGTYLTRKWQRNERPIVGEFVVCTLVGVGVALLPDLLEPATGPSHRSHLHSMMAGAALAYLSTRIWRMSELGESERILYVVGCLAYLSHLALDLRTPAGLPFA